MIIVERSRVDISEMKVGLKFRVSVVIFHDGHILPNFMEYVLKGISFAEGLEGQIGRAHV